MKKTTFLKTLLMAVGLCMGGNAWGGTTNLVNIDYTTITTPAWSNGSIVDGTWKHTHDGGTGPRSAYLDFGVNSSIEDNWTASFDVTISTGSTWTQSSNYQVAITKNGASYSDNAVVGSADILLGASIATTKSNMGSDLACTITLNGTDVSGTTTLSHGVKYTFNISVDGTSLTASIMNGSKTVYSGNATLDAFVKPRGLYSLLPRPYNASWGVYTNTFDNILVTKEVTAEEVSAPSIAVAYAGANRTVTIIPGVSSESNAVTTYYTLDGSDPTSSSSVYSTPLDIDENCTVKAITISSTSVASAITSQAVTVGKLKLATPTWTKTGYSDGSYTVELSSNQSGLAYPPASTTLYYSVNDGSPTEYSSPFSVAAGSTVTGYVTATNYTNSDNANMTTAVRPVLSEVWSIDFASQATEDKGGVTVGETAFAANGVNFGNISGSFTSNDNFGVKTGSSWLLRNGSRGLYSSNGSGTPVGVAGLTAGQYVRMVVSGMTSCSVSDAASLVNDMSTPTELYIVANENGNANIHFNRYVYIKSIAVCDVVTSVSKTITSAGWATYCSPYALDFSSSIPNLTKAYLVTGATGSTLNLADITGTVPANTGILLEGEGPVTIPVVASSSTNVSANKLVGKTAEYNLAAEGGYVLMGSPRVGFYKNSNDFTVGANTAYLPSNFAGARMAFFGFDDEATGVQNLTPALSEGEGVVYNLRGQRVAQPTKGLYIVNGKKVVIK